MRDSTSAPALSVADISVHFGGLRAVDRASVDVAPGEIVGIIGPNGAGKTTLLNAVSGFVTCTGSVELAGHDITGILPYRRARLGLGRSFQDARLYPTLTVRQTLSAALHSDHSAGIFAEGFGLRRARREAAEIAQRAEALCDLVDLNIYLDHRISELSFGTTRAVELAWLAARRPSVLLLDEPASGLQQSEVRELGAVIERLRGDAAVVVIDHDVPFVAGLGERLIAMDLGEVIADGTPDDVLADDRVITSYLGSGNYVRSEAP